MARWKALAEFLLSVG